ncbi:MAG: TMEM43 family protein [Alphaproteobacteria bacterium]|nr:TMEM43 family protein [Alphaproteobacteria bacterium]
MQETTHTGFGSKIVDSIKGIFFGFILIIVGVSGLFINEGRVSPKTIFSKVSTITSDATNEKNGLIVLEGTPVINKKIADTYPSLLEPQSAVYINKLVEVYAWVETSTEETKENLGGSSDTTTTYNYKKEWTSNPPNSDNFKDKSGAYVNIIPTMKGGLSSQSFSLNNISIPAIQEKDSVFSKPLILSKNNVQDKNSITTHTHLFIGKNAHTDTPSIGDIRVSFNVIHANEKISAFGEKKDNNFSFDVTYKGDDQTGFIGVGSASQVLSTAQEQFKTSMWVIRGIGFIVIWIGFVLMTSIIPTLASVIPFLGSLTRGILGFALGIVSLIISFVVIIISNIFHNPIALVVVVVVIVGWIFYFYKKSKKNK